MSYVEEPNPKSHKCYRYPSGLLLGLLLLLLQSSPRRVFQHNIIPRIIATTTHNTSHLTSLKFNPLRAFLPLTSRPSTPVSLFIGIVEEMGTVKHLGTSPHGSFDLKITASTVLHGVNLGYSIAVNDTCLTVTEFDVKVFDFMVGPSPETLRKTSLSKLEPDMTVNLERAIIQSSRMGEQFNIILIVNNKIYK